MRSFLVLAALLLANVPSSSATWSFQGDAEPSTPYDGPAFMWGGPAEAGVRGRVYFNVVTLVGSTGAGGGVANPNVAALGSRIAPFGAVTHEAMLGVWVDCNQDGDVGLAESAVREYSSALLTDDSLCPPVSGSPNAWVPGAHNYNAWVSEYVPIGNGQALATDRRVYRDDEAMVWGDRGRPFAHQERCGGGHGDVVLVVADCLAEYVGRYEPAPGMADALPRLEPAEVKRSADWNFHFLTATRGAFPASLVGRGGAGHDASFGLMNEGSRWVADSYRVEPLPRTTDGDLDRPLGEPTWSTFYAHVGAATLAHASTPGGHAAYGFPVCGDADEGILHGWDCDASAWYRYPDGSPYPEGKRTLARPGQPYRLRDVDCHDGGTSTGLGAGTSFYGEAPCTFG